MFHFATTLYYHASLLPAGAGLACFFLLCRSPSRQLLSPSFNHKITCHMLKETAGSLKAMKSMTNPAHNFYILVITWHPPRTLSWGEWFKWSRDRPSHMGLLTLGLQSCLKMSGEYELAASLFSLWEWKVRLLVLEGPARSSNYRDSSRLTCEGAEARGGGWLEQGHTARRGTQTSDSQVRVCSRGAVVSTIGQGSSSELEKAHGKQSPWKHHQRRLQGSTSSPRSQFHRSENWGDEKGDDVPEITCIQCQPKQFPDQTKAIVRS